MLANETEQPLEQKKKALKDNLAQVGMLSNATAKIIDNIQEEIPTLKRLKELKN